MPTKQTKKHRATAKKSTKPAVVSQPIPKKWILSLRHRVRLFLARRPHRSFRLTRRRDYVRSLELPGYMSFTSYVFETLWKNKALMSCIVLLYGFLTFIFVGFASQDMYKTLSDTLTQTGSEIFKGSFGKIGEAALLVLSGASGNFTTAPTEAQQVYAVITSLLAWLTTVWALRAILAGQRPRFRDALYGSGAPIVSTFLVVVVIAIQLIPAAIALLIINAAISSDFISSGAIAMIIYVAAALLFVLSLYWMTSSMIALVIVTLPGKYPMQAIRAAGDIVIGRRLRILLRFVWMSFAVMILWIIVAVPVILFDSWIKGIWPAIEWVPFVPLVLLVMSSFTVVFGSAYTYLLYRKVVDDDAKPA